MAMKTLPSREGRNRDVESRRLSQDARSKRFEVCQLTDYRDAAAAEGERDGRHFPTPDFDLNYPRGQLRKCALFPLRISPPLVNRNVGGENSRVYETAGDAKGSCSPPSGGNILPLSLSGRRGDGGFLFCRVVKYSIL